MSLDTALITKSSIVNCLKSRNSHDIILIKKNIRHLPIFFVKMIIFLLNVWPRRYDFAIVHICLFMLFFVNINIHFFSIRFACDKYFWCLFDQLLACLRCMLKQSCEFNCMLLEKLNFYGVLSCHSYVSPSETIGIQIIFWATCIFYDIMQNKHYLPIMCYFSLLL